MACPCEGPCDPQPFRCSCQRDCWIGDPDDYDACMAACDPACTAPHIEGLPSGGYRCPVWPSAGYTTCNDPCFDDRQDAIDVCQTARADCEFACIGSGGGPECYLDCASTECSCLGGAESDYQACNYPCDRDYTYPAAFGCLAASIAEDRDCCNTTWSDALYDCEAAYLSAAAAIEYAWLLCVYNSLPIAGVFNPATSVCDLGGSLNLSCAAARLDAMAEIQLTRAECTSAADEAERRRAAPADRKFAECGMAQRCRDNCEAAHAHDRDECGVTYLGCITSCDGITDPIDLAACVYPCETAFRACWIPIEVARVGCYVGCCKTDAPHAPNSHARADCRLECYEDYISGQVACGNTLESCQNGCASVDDDTARAACLDTCAAAFCFCKNATVTAHDACIDTCDAAHRGDCPDCYDSAIEADAAGGPAYTLGIALPGPLPSVECS